MAGLYFSTQKKYTLFTAKTFAMTNSEKKEKIKSLVKEMLTQSTENMMEKIDSVLDSQTVDVENWNDSRGPMLFPKCIIKALMEHEIFCQYDGRGTSYEKYIKKKVEILRSAISYSLLK